MLRSYNTVLEFKNRISIVPASAFVLANVCSIAHIQIHLQYFVKPFLYLRSWIRKIPLNQIKEKEVDRMRWNNFISCSFVLLIFFPSLPILNIDLPEERNLCSFFSLNRKAHTHKAQYWCFENLVLFAHSVGIFLPIVCLFFLCCVW